MKKKSITFLAVALSAVLSATTPANDTLRLGDVQELEEVSITSTRTKVASEKLRVVSTISQEDIRAIPARNISDLLENIPGLDLRTRGGNGVQADLSMRGGTFDQVVIMLNGINITDPQTGHYNLELPIDLSLIDRIEILQGTSMNIFGLSAFSGAINIVTGTSREDKTTATIAAGDHGYVNAALGANYGVGKWILTGSASYNRSEGYMENSDYEYGNMMLQAVCNDPSSGNWNIQLGGQLKNFGANVFYSLAYPNQYEENKTMLGSLSWDKRFGDFGVEVSMYGRVHNNHYELIRDFINAPEWYTTHNNHIATTGGVNAKGAWYSWIGKTAAGIEVRNENILSNVLGDRLDEPKPVPGYADDVMFLYGKNRLNINYFAEQSFFADKFSASIGVSGNYNTMFKNNFAFGANIGYEYARGGNVFASVNRSLRLPTFTDLYYKSATQTANPELRPEESLTTEVGINYSRYGFTGHLSAYYRVGKNIIDWIKLPEETQWKSMNHSRVDAMGGEVSLAYSYGYWLKKAEISYSYCNLTKDAGEYISKYALDYLRHKLTFAIHHGIYRGFGASWTLSYQSRNGEYNDREGNVAAYRPIWLLDGRIYWENPKIRLFVEATNITNRKYYDYGGILQPGIWVKGGITVKI